MLDYCFYLQPELLKAVTKKLESIDFITDTLVHGDAKFMVRQWTLKLKYRKFSNKGTSPNKGTPWFFLTFPRFTFLPISQLIIVQFSFCKKTLEGYVP